MESALIESEYYVLKLIPKTTALTIELLIHVKASLLQGVEISKN